MATKGTKIEDDTVPTEVSATAAEYEFLIEKEVAIVSQATGTNIENTQDTRLRKQTAKGHEYQVDLLRRQYKSISNTLNHQWLTY